MKQVDTGRLSLNDKHFAKVGISTFAKYSFLK